MALDIATCIKLLKVMWNNKWMAKHDPYVPPVDWNQEQFSETRPLRIGKIIVKCIDSVVNTG
jgi:hypothetical protein